MKILILANNDIGLYKFRKELIEELIKKGHKIYISLPNGTFVKSLTALGCEFIDTPVERRGMNPKTDLKLMVTYFKQIKRIHPDLVLTYTIKPNIYGGIACRSVNVPYAVNITGLGTAFQRDGILKKMVILLYKIAVKKANVVFFENTLNCQEFVNNKIVNEKQTCVLNGAGVNLEEYPISEYPDRDEIRFLFIGRVMKEKGIDEFLAAARQMREQYSNVFFDIVGPMEDDYREVIQQSVDLSIIEYHGFQEDVRPFIVNCNCFVLPSYHEGMANTLLECGAMGRPLITSRIHGCLEAVEEGKSGFLANPKNVEELYQCFEKFVRMPKDEKKRMGECSRKHIEKYFNKRDIVEKTIHKILQFCEREWSV